MKNPITSSSAHNVPASAEAVTQNIGRLIGRTVKSLIYAGEDQHELVAFFIRSFAGLALFGLYESICKDQCSLNSFSFSLVGLTLNFCTVVKVSCIFMLLRSLIIPILRYPQHDEIFREIRNDLRRPLTLHLKNTICSKVKLAVLFYQHRFGLPYTDKSSFMIRSHDGTQAVVYTPSEGTSFHSLQDASSLEHIRPARIEPLTHNTGWLIKRSVKVLLKSTFGGYGQDVAAFCLFTAVMALAVAIKTCPKMDQNNNEMCPASVFRPIAQLNTCPVPSSPNIACLASGYYSTISFIAAIAIMCIPGMTQYLTD